MSLTDYLASKTTRLIESHNTIESALLKNDVGTDDKGRWRYRMANLVSLDNVRRYFNA
ncbi:hypothetical protein SEA_GOLDILOCKS_121 [Mycobacterium phage Goldilocks]|nr:hypothetical protein SEA_GOLDILOCKS_121 [Mycobacterium phage Goldilocks]